LRILAKDEDDDALRRHLRNVKISRSSKNMVVDEEKDSGSKRKATDGNSDTSRLLATTAPSALPPTPSALTSVALVNQAATTPATVAIQPAKKSRFADIPKAPVSATPQLETRCI
jgi:hypothetical protein